ncbi:dihydroxy-acid/6-phosphogluconate dehydratase [Penicillium malachiteum]|uniref:Dihydroxy-acid/6-phosphogluconate dehydratase n=1 Tax=Penicillium malachiteum TaxID=1324776 RepID=A0AAD6HP38_9EURO|nr:dihydroxy-acid/6-phosphogluconate dehydratase [Penicillium malachiteum]
MNSDYDLDKPIEAKVGLRQGLTSYGDAHFSLFLRKVFIKALGYSEKSLEKPIIGIVNTFSGFNPCHANVPQLIEAVKRGVHLNGGLAVEFPTISIHESFSSPTSMYLRNLTRCDKTTVAQLMGGLSANKPILHLVTGPMMTGKFKGVRIGACTDCRNNWAKFRVGEIDIEDISAINEDLAPTGGTCGVMGTASTMACVLVGLVLMPFAGATAAAVSSARLRVAEKTGGNAVKLCQQSESLRPQTLLTREAFLNAITVLQAIGGSTNVVVHLMAIIGRHPSVSGTITLETFNEIGSKTPLLVDLKPSGSNYMTDFHDPGGMLSLLHKLKPLLHLDALTTTGLTLGQELAKAAPMSLPQELSCIQPFDKPLYAKSSLVVLKGNLALGGAVNKASASKRRELLNHIGHAVIFKNSIDLTERIDDPDLDVNPDDILVLQNIGPVGNPGMPEAGIIPIPRKLSTKGVSDMIRISDGRMSGTAGGTIVLHVSPEAANPSSVLGIVQSGDTISLDVEARTLNVDITEEEILRRQEDRKEAMTKE